MTRFALLLPLILLAVPAAAEQAPRVVAATDTRLGGDEKATRLIVDLESQVAPRVFTLADPYRVIVDLPEVSFGTKALPHQARGLVSAYRFGLIAPGRSRIVIDTTKPVKAVLNSVPAQEGQPARLIVDMTPTSESAFLSNMRSDTGRGDRLPEPAAPKVAADAADTRPVIVIDPGHGGIDTGAKAAGGEEEKQVVLEFAHTLREKLTASGRYRVAMTREDDSFIALADRVRFARENAADLLLSIHADSLSADPFGVRGATIYTLSDRASDAEAERLAEKENRADIIAGVDLSEEPDDVAGILIDLARRETRVFSSRFAGSLVSSVGKAIRLNKNPQRAAGFVVLKAPDVPSALLELGYMSSREDLKLLLSRGWRDKAADAIVTSMDAYFAPRTTAKGGGSSVN